MEDFNEICPFCGGKVVRVEVTSAAGTRAYSLCCDVPTTFIDNYDVYAALPEPLQQASIEREKAEFERMRQEDAEAARRFEETRKEWFTRHPELFKSEGEL